MNENAAQSAGPESEFESYLSQGKFMIQRSSSTGEHVFYPRLATPGSDVRDLEWVEATGNGTVYSTTVVRRRPEQGGDFNIALIDLEEGPRMMSRVTDIAPEDVTIGMAVVARVGDLDGEPVVLFSPSEGA